MGIGLSSILSFSDELQKIAELPKVEEALKNSVSTIDELKKQLKSGDILFTAPNRKSLSYFWRYGFKPVSRLVQDTDYGHATMYVGGGKIIDARIGAPSKERKLERVAKRNNVIALRPDVPDGEKHEAIKYIKEHKGTTFDVPAILRAATPFRGRREPKGPEESRELICSALIANAYNRRKFSESSRLMTRPSEIINHPVMKPVAARAPFNK